MKIRMSVLLLVGVMFCVAVGNLHAQETEIDVNETQNEPDEIEKGAYISVGGFTNYIFRGQKLSEHWVIQPSIGINYGGFGANLWANQDMDTGETSETDLTVSYAHSLGRLNLEGGYIYFALDAVEDTQEGYVKVGYDILLEPTLTFYYDFDEGDGGFLTLSVGHSFGLPYGLSLNLGAYASVNFENEVLGLNSSGNEFTNFYNGEVSASLTIPVYKDITVEPMVAYTFPLSNEGEDAIESLSFDEDSEVVYGGVTVSLSF